MAPWIAGPFACYGPRVTDPLHIIDRAWCDLQGVYLEGWVHWWGRPVEAAALVCGEARVPLELLTRPDVEAAFPDVPRGQATGFKAYLACAPLRPVWIELRSGEAVGRVEVVVGPGAGPVPPAGSQRPAPLEAFAAAMKARGGTVIELGARVVGSHSSLNAGLFAPECRFVGVDIHPAPGVDVVADAHALSRAFPSGSVDGVFSLAVMEHIAAPWVVAAEINKVLRVGGETLHLVPHAWPVHEQPNDFWRFSDDGLRLLFGAATGFEVLDCGLAHPVQIVPGPELRHGAYLQLPMVFAYTAAWIYARKVAEVGVVAWPMEAAASEALARAYPAHGAGHAAVG